MFVNIMQFPPVSAERESAFHQWFTWSNEQYTKHPGFIRRTLLKSHKQGNYVALIEHESKETFMAMHTSSSQAEAHDRLMKIIDAGPTAQFYDTIEG